MIPVAVPRRITLVVRWEASAEGVSYDLPSMICTVPVPADLHDDEVLNLAHRITAERVADAYPHGPDSDEPIEPSWVFEDDALCLVEAVFEGEPALIGAWAHSTVI
ncbi:hypothetical protein CIB93_09130 [Streptomyces sp. WZ.A104]|uniref:hypothetical protein n=1 Tax=Streptomyces sp. WZ.A104 TaxID=2023771 RepID=UPI000BBBB299|nr:hypothetical protein [Streptomyces sp. WZ.A104]PCG86384.1 hypothetical protein CIB93_09130 [Streptomyces sp. WZ.A104]